MIVLATHNARWIHTAFGLRCLRANLGALRDRSQIVEFELSDRATDAAERLLALSPEILGVGVYVWNAAEALELVRTVKALRPDLPVVLGGPEVSHECDRQEICALAAHVVRGEGDVAFRELCDQLLAGESPPKFVDAEPPKLTSPYGEYTDEDVAHRVVYVESSRGCPFTCEFCLSALDVPVRKAELDAFLASMGELLKRGVRHFKFVDRTFNLGVAHSIAILRWFREHWCEGMFLHFELIPDRLPEPLRAEIAALPDGGVQFEIGVQTLDDDTSERISRRQDVGKLRDNLRWLRTSTGAHLHVDLIMGLPGEDEASFARGFDELHGLRPHEIQVGVLKRLRGTPIVRHDDACGMVYSQQAPYEILQTGAVPFGQMQAMKRFARFWDLVANRGNWNETLALLLCEREPYASFRRFADWLFAQTGATSHLALARLAKLLFGYLTGERALDASEVGAVMLRDYRRCGRTDWPKVLDPYAAVGARSPLDRGRDAAGDSRQQRHRVE